MIILFENFIMFFPCVICYNDVRPRQHALECDSCLRWQHRTCGSGVTVLEYRNWTGDQEYICSVCRDAEPWRTLNLKNYLTLHVDNSKQQKWGRFGLGPI